MDSYGDCSSVYGNSRGDLARARWRDKVKDDARTKSDGGKDAAQRIVHVDVRTSRPAT